MGFSPLVIASDQRQTFSDESAVRSRKRTCQRVEGPHPAKNFASWEHCQNHDVGSPPSFGSKWMEGAAYFLLHLPCPSVLFQMNHEPSLKEDSSHQRGLEPIAFYPGGAPGHSVRYRVHWGVPIALAAFRSRAPRAADSPLLPISFLALGRVGRFARFGCASI